MAERGDTTHGQELDDQMDPDRTQAFSRLIL